MISEIRKHIKDQIKSCSSRYTEIVNPFPKAEDLIETKADMFFASIFGTSNNILEDEDGNVVEIPVIVRTYVQGGGSKLANFDKGYCQALMIKDLILDISSINSKDYIKGITSSSVVPEEVDNSQDIYSYETNFNFTISYGSGD